MFLSSLSLNFCIPTPSIRIVDFIWKAFPAILEKNSKNQFASKNSLHDSNQTITAIVCKTDRLQAWNFIRLIINLIHESIATIEIWSLNLNLVCSMLHINSSKVKSNVLKRLTLFIKLFDSVGENPSETRLLPRKFRVEIYRTFLWIHCQSQRYSNEH